jgi:phosphatidate cytidylyltransferase
VTAAALIAAFLAVLFLLPRALLAIVAALLVAAAGDEWGRLCRLEGWRAWTYGALVAAAFALLFAAGEPGMRAAFVAAAIFWLVAAPIWLWRGVQAAQRSALVVSGFLVLVPAGLALTALEPAAVLAVLVLVWVADTAAYFVGRRLGRHQLAPAISPGKTWEGAAAGVLGALAYAIICTGFVERIAWLPLVAGAVVLAVLSIVGDLFESAGKRQAGVKDSGALLPGHGGILDRIDSATAVLPLAALLLSWMRANG